MSKRGKGGRPKSNKPVSVTAIRVPAELYQELIYEATHYAEQKQLRFRETLGECALRLIKERRRLKSELDEYSQRKLEVLQQEVVSKEQ